MRQMITSAINSSIPYVLRTYMYENKYVISTVSINSSPPPPLVPYIYMRQWIGSELVQIMACRLLGAKPLSKPMLGYYPRGS